MSSLFISFTHLFNNNNVLNLFEQPSNSILSVTYWCSKIATILNITDNKKMEYLFNDDLLDEEFHSIKLRKNASQKYFWKKMTPLHGQNDLVED